MNPTSRAFRERDRTRVACVRLTAMLLACLCPFAPRSASGLMADEEKPPSSSSQNGQTEGRPPEEKSREQKNKPAQETRAGSKTAAPPKPTPGPTPDPPFRFDDFDLEKFHRPARGDDEADEGEAADTAAGASGTTAGGTAPQAPPVKERPKPAAAKPGPDPVKPARNVQGQEMPRQSQVQAGRQRIAGLQARLAELRARRDTLANPATARAGQSEGGQAPVNPGTPPAIDADKTGGRTAAANDLLRQVDREIRSLEEEIEAAKSELASVEIRFAQESRTR